MKEQLISFETAKLAKEKGFNQNPYKTQNCYMPKYTNGENIHLNSSLKNPQYNIAVAPTQSLLQKWLRENHGLCAYIDWYNGDAVIVDFKNYNGDMVYKEEYHLLGDDTESQLDNLLQEALKLIKS